MKVMYRIRRILRAAACAGLAVTATATTLPAAAEGPSPTVVELFTSQGCSSCPPADAALASLRDHPDILTLTWAVDYWDRLGWQDTFAEPNNAVRQTAYNKRLGRGGVYTPQMVFDGVDECVGSDRTHIRDLLEKLKAGQQTHISVTLKADGDNLTVDLPATDIGEEIAVRLVWYLSDATVEIGDGENAGRTLHYTNVVRGSDIIADWTGDARRLKLDIAAGRTLGADHAAILLQKGYGHGPIVGSASTNITSPAANP